MIEEKEIGARIRALRNKRGLVLEDMSKKTGFTKGYLSKLENSEKAPPVSTLIGIAKALGVRLSEIFGEGGAPVSRCITPKSERLAIARDGSSYGYSYESLAHGYPYRSMDPYLITIPPNKEQPLFRHRGEEFIYILEGKVMVFHGDEKFVVEEGDCAYFDASIPHNSFSLDGNPAKSMMIIFTPEVGDDNQR